MVSEFITVGVSGFDTPKTDAVRLPKWEKTNDKCNPIDGIESNVTSCGKEAQLVLREFTVPLAFHYNHSNT